jgi:hypothetical protein
MKQNNYYSRRDIAPTQYSRVLIQAVKLALLIVSRHGNATPNLTGFTMKIPAIRDSLVSLNRALMRFSP